MEKNIKALIQSCKSDINNYNPTFFRLKHPAERKKFYELLDKNSKILVFDEILGQVEELVKSRHPKKVFKKPDLTEAAKEFLQNSPWEEYGVWVFYPWSNRLVHILDEKEFIEVRTNRNQYKITPQERDVLSNKKIGVIGLSIGQSIAMTMAMERIFGEIRLADFDILELSNYNRIRTGLFNLGISKVVCVAREIAEIDPFLKVVCFTKGLLEENINDFFLKDGKLDLLVEACDGLDMKIISRKKAKELKVPVVMDTSDRGMLDVERFDLEPQRSILHGLIDHLDSSKLKGLTNEEKIPFLLPIVGLETMSTRLKASMLEIEQSITTWPQLASSVALGGAVTTDVSRRILLNEFNDSGRYFIDIEELISDKNKIEIKEKPLNIRPSLTFSEMVDLINQSGDKLIANQVKLSDQIITELVAAASMAPSGANIQPWRWVYHNNSLYLFFDDVYSAGLLDCGNTISFASLGAACENLILKAHELKFEVIMSSPPLEKKTKLVSIFKFFDKISSEISLLIEPHVCDDLVTAIPNRLTNRNIRKRQNIDKSKFEALQTVARTIPGADLLIIDDEKTMRLLGEVTAKMDRIRVMHEGGHRDFRAEIRWTPEEVKQACNGVDLVGTVDLTPAELAGWKIAKQWPVIKMLNDWEVGTGLEKIQRKSVEGASALGLLTMPEFGCNHFFLGGRAMERIWLKATMENISVHPASLSTLIFNTLIHGEEDVFSPNMRKEALKLRKEFEQLFSIKSQIGEVLLFRFFIADPPKARSIRYPIDRILFFSKDTAS